VQDLELKMQDLEAQANLKEQQIKKTQKARVSCDEGNEGPVKEEGNDEKENSGSKTTRCGNPSAFCALMWGGPTMACSDDTLFSFFERFFGGVTTAHGINRVFDDGIGPLRRIFWVGMSIIGIYGAAYFVGSVIDDYIAKGVTTSATEALHEGPLPMVSVCNLSPFQCSCEDFYDPRLMQDAHFDKVLPYLCRDVVVFKEESPDKLDPKSGERVQFSTLEASTVSVSLSLSLSLTHTHKHTSSSWLLPLASICLSTTRLVSC